MSSLYLIWRVDLRGVGGRGWNLDKKGGRGAEGGKMGYGKRGGERSRHSCKLCCRVSGRGGGSPVPIEINEKKKMVGAMRDCAMQSSLIDF